MLTFSVVIMLGEGVGQQSGSRLAVAGGTAVVAHTVMGRPVAEESSSEVPVGISLAVDGVERSGGGDGHSDRRRC
jgi:hypothetical protein